MAKNETFKKKKLNKKDYSGKEKGAKIVKGAAGAVGVAVIVPKAIKGIGKIAKKVIFKA